MERRIPYRIINKTRYDSQALDDLVRYIEHKIRGKSSHYAGLIIFMHSTPTGSFHGDPALVKMERYTRREDGFEVGVIKPTRTGKCFVGLNELEILAAMASSEAPLTLRRQLCYRIAKGMSDRYASNNEYTDRRWCADAPPLPFYDVDPSRERVEWEQKRADLLQLQATSRHALSYYRGEVESNQRGEDKYRELKERFQGKTEKALRELDTLNREFDAFLRLGPPL